MTMLKHKLARAALCALAIGLAACNETTSPETGGPDVGMTGEFTATLSGAVSTQITGFAQSSGATDEGWSVHLLTPGGGNSILIVTEGVGRPAPGDYTIADIASTLNDAPAGEYSVFVGLEGDASAVTGFFSVSGTLTITASSSEAVSGSFSFTGADPSDLSVTVTVEGNFTSRNQGD
jgi:hypothetical protein